MIHDEQNLDALASMIAELCDTERIAGFVVLVATFKEDGTPTGQIITSTPSMRSTANLVDIAREQLAKELDRLSGLS